MSKCCDGGPIHSDGEKTVAISTGSEKGVSAKTPAEKSVGATVPTEKSVGVVSPTERTVGVVTPAGKTIAAIGPTEKSVSAPTSTEKATLAASLSEKSVAVPSSSEKSTSAVSPTEKGIGAIAPTEKTLACYLPDLDDVNDATVFTTAGHVLRATGTEWVNAALAIADLAAKDHDLLDGLLDDDHTQYHTDARGDVRYYTQAQIDARELKNMTDVSNFMSPSASDIFAYLGGSWSSYAATVALNNSLGLKNLSDVDNSLSPSTGDRLGYHSGGYFTTIGPRKGQLAFIIDGSGLAIGTTGIRATLRVPYDCTVTGWDIVSPLESGSCKIDVYYDTYANYPPTIADVITGSETPQLTTAQKAQDTSLTTWTTTDLAEGAYLAFDVVSVDTTTRVELYLYVQERHV